jgi:hypothetical protein
MHRRRSSTCQCRTHPCCRAGCQDPNTASALQEASNVQPYVQSHARTIGVQGGYAGDQERGAVMWPLYADAQEGYTPTSTYREEARCKSSSSDTVQQALRRASLHQQPLTPTSPCDQVPRRTTTMLPKKFKAI